MGTVIRIGQNGKGQSKATGDAAEAKCEVCGWVRVASPAENICQPCYKTESAFMAEMNKDISQPTGLRLVKPPSKLCPF
jgi:hypothetical protein